MLVRAIIPPMKESVIAHDVIVIGGGSSGYATARTTRDAGADVAIVDHGPLVWARRTAREITLCPAQR